MKAIYTTSLIRHTLSENINYTHRHKKEDSGLLINIIEMKFSITKKQLADLRRLSS